MGISGARIGRHLILISLLAIASTEAFAKVPVCIRLMQNIGVDGLFYGMPKLKVAKIEDFGTSLSYQFTNGLSASARKEDSLHEFTRVDVKKKYGIAFDYKFEIAFTGAGSVSPQAMALEHHQNALVAQHRDTFYYENSVIEFSYGEKFSNRPATLMAFDLAIIDSGKDPIVSRVVLSFDRARYLRRVVVQGNNDPRTLAHYGIRKSSIFGSDVLYDLNEDSDEAKAILKAILKRSFKHYRLRADAFHTVAREQSTGEPIEFGQLFE
jgi:hypothetical protein